MSWITSVARCPLWLMPYLAQGQRPSSPFRHSKETPGLESSQLRVTLSPSLASRFSSFLVKMTGAAERWKGTTAFLSTVWGEDVEAQDKMIVWDDDTYPSYQLLPERRHLLRLQSSRRRFPCLLVSSHGSVAHNWNLFDSFGIFLHD